MQTIEAALYLARNLGAVAVAPVELMVTPAPCARVTWPAPICAMFITSPALNTLGGTVKVIELALFSVTSWLRLPATSVCKLCLFLHQTLVSILGLLCRL